MTQSAASGNNLFHLASDLYAWFMASSISPTAEAKVFQLLSKLMQIAKLSSQGGQFLSMKEEKAAMQRLCSLKEHLYDGTIKKESAAAELSSLVHDMISSNSKARVVSYATELEYHFCILSPPSTFSSNLKKFLEGLLQKLTPALLEIQAYAIGQIMAKALENPKAHPDISYALETEMQKWLPSGQDSSISRGDIG